MVPKRPLPLTADVVLNQLQNDPADIANVATVLASTHRRYPDVLPDVLPLFTGIMVLPHREIIAHLLNTEPDWPWQKPTQKPLPSESNTIKE